MTGKKSTPNKSKSSILEWIRLRLDWIIRFHKFSHIVRFSFWISLLGSIVLLATDQSVEILRVIAEDSRHRLLLFSVSVLILSLMSWYWARALIYRFAPAELELPKCDPDGVAARWLPRICGLIPFVGIGLALLRATSGLDPGSPARFWLILLFVINAVEAVAVGVFLYFRRQIAKKLSDRDWWPKAVGTNDKAHLSDLPKITKIILRITLGFSVAFFVLFSTSFGEMRAAGWFAPASLVVLSAAAWIAITSYFVIYFGRLVKLPILTPLLLLAILFSYLDLNDNHKIRAYDQPIKTAPTKFDKAFKDWLESRQDKDAYKGRPYPVFIITAEGGGITTAYLTATVLTAIQDRAPAFAQHVFAISGVSGGSLGTAVYAGLAKRCTNNWKMDQLPSHGNRVDVTGIGPLQNSADIMLTDDYLSPLLAALLYPEMTQKLLPFPIYPWDRARALEDRLETSWNDHANCGPTPPVAASAMSEPFYDFFQDFPANSTPAIFFNTTNVETGERMFVTNLQVADEARFDTLPALCDVNQLFNIRFSTAACLSGRFPLITPAGFLYDDRPENQRKKFRYVDGGYYENSGTATGYSILMSLKWHGKYLYDQLRPIEDASSVPEERKKESQQKTDEVPIIPIVIRIGFPVPPSRNPKYQTEQTTAEERGKYKGTGLSEISPVKAILNTRGARGNDAVEQMETAIRSLHDPKVESPKDANIDSCPTGSLGCMFRFLLDEHNVKLPLGWMLSQLSRCQIQNQVGSISGDCNQLVSPANANATNQRQLQEIIALLTTR
jgi:Patatin-like phospholipase